MPRNIETGESGDLENLPDAEKKKLESKIELRRIKEVTDPRSLRSVKKIKPGVTHISDSTIEEQDGTYFDYDYSPEELSVKDFLENLPPMDFSKLGPNKNGECTLNYRAKKHILDIMIEQGEEHEYRHKGHHVPHHASLSVGELKPLGKEVWRSGVVLDISAGLTEEHYPDDTPDDEPDDGYQQQLDEEDLESDAMGEAIEKTIKKAEELKEKIQSHGIDCEIAISTDAQNLVEKYREHKEGGK